MLETRSVQRCHAGELHWLQHAAHSTATPMRCGLYLPPQARESSVPLLLVLAGLTCNEETFLIKSGAIAHAARLGLALLAPDTSPRDTGIPGETGDWEFGTAASFYLDATAAPWATHYRMQSWVLDELPAAIAAAHPVDLARMGICGHSMGGHGALTLALKFPQRLRSVSAFAPICAPTQVPWGQKALPRYLGEDPSAWAAHDAVALIRAGYRAASTLLVDQGEADGFLHGQLRPDLLQAACVAMDHPLDLHMHAGYDHSYWFIQSFIQRHVEHHAQVLGAPGR